MVIHRKCSELSSTQWAGGQTTELAIYPFEASYVNRNFIFRISTAKVEVECSTFTSLPGFQRSLMVLDGSLKLLHEGHHSAELNPFEIDVFRGEWKTSSQGMATDFNVMTSDLATHQVKYEAGMQGDSIRFGAKEKLFWNAIYVLSGCLVLAINSEIVSQGDFLLFNQDAVVEMRLKENSTWIYVEIQMI